MSRSSILSSETPTGSAVLTSYYKTTFNVWALQSTADLRPDLRLANRNFVSLPGYLETLAACRNPLAGLVRTWRDQRGPPIRHLDHLARERSLFIELDVNLDRALTERLHAAGPLARYGLAGPAGEHARRMAAWRAALGRRPWERETTRSAVWAHYLLARFACQRSLATLAAEQLGAGLTLAPHDRRLRRLRASCPPLRR